MVENARKACKYQEIRPRDMGFGNGDKSRGKSRAVRLQAWFSRARGEARGLIAVQREETGRVLRRGPDVEAALFC
jgi:hypothetical protein